MKVKSVNIIANEKNAEPPSHGALMLFFPCASNSPNDGDPGGNPSPRKSKEVRAVIEPVRIKGIMVSVATTALGKM